MYIKMIGGLFLLSSAAAIGFIKAEELNERVKNLQTLKRMIMLLQGELRFHRAELSEAFENIAERMESPFSDFLLEVSNGLKQRTDEGLEQIWCESSKCLLCAEGFLKEDAKLLELLGGSLGYLDLTMQTEHLNLVMLRTEETIEEAKKIKESRGKLYQTMGVTVGALLTLLII